MAAELGADEVINYSETNLKDAIKELTDGKGVDVVLEISEQESIANFVQFRELSDQYRRLGFQFALFGSEFFRLVQQPDSL